MAESTTGPEDIGETSIVLNELPAAETSVISTSVIVEGTIMSDWWRRQAQSTQRDFMDLIRESINSGESTDQMIARLRGGTIDGVEVKGIMDIARNRARALVRTGANAVLNDARTKTFQENNDLVSAIEQLSTLDNRTSTICIAYSGQVWDVDSLEPVPPSTLPFNGGPPRHFNCRSTLVPVLRSFEELSPRDKRRIGRGKRASMDGTVPADITFDAWLKKKPAAFADQLLGKGKARLWRKNKITLTQLVDMRGEPMSLTQLEDKLGIVP